MKLGKVDDISVHVFFADTVGLSDPNLGSTDEQRIKLNVLFRFITDSPILKKYRTTVIISVTGDGVVICFKESPRLPYELALELHKKLRKYNKNKSFNEKINIRIGINSGTILPTRGVADIKNYWGRGIIHAQRIMSFGDSKHILLTASTAQELMELSSQYKKSIHYIGRERIKHKEIIPVFSAYGNGFGNKRIPSSFQKQQERDEYESGRLIIRALKKNQINPTSFLEVLAKLGQSKLNQMPKNNKRRKRK